MGFAVDLVMGMPVVGIILMLIVLLRRVTTFVLVFMLVHGVMFVGMSMVVMFNVLCFYCRNLAAG